MASILGSPRADERRTDEPDRADGSSGRGGRRRRLVPFLLAGGVAAAIAVRRRRKRAGATGEPTDSVEDAAEPTDEGHDDETTNAGSGRSRLAAVTAALAVVAIVAIVAYVVRR